jgi:hypothetical protein
MRNPIVAVVVTMITLILAGCQDAGSPANKDFRPAASAFHLEDTQGLARTSFAAADTVVCVYMLRNPRITEREFYRGHGGPWVRFMMQRDTIIVEDSYSGAMFPAVVVRGRIGSGETIETRWTLALGRTPRVLGTYTMVADPQLSLDEDESLPNLVSPITIQ